MHSPWHDFMGRLELDAPWLCPSHGLALVPILDPDPRPLEVFPLRWGIEHGRTRVEAIGGGRGDRVRVDHTGATPLLVLDGEVVGGNRVFDASFLVPAKGTADLPVSTPTGGTRCRTTPPARIDEMRAKLRLKTGQVGIAAVDVHGELTLDVFGSPGALNRSWTVVARGLLADPEPGDPCEHSMELVRECLDALARTQPRSTPAPGLGETLQAATGDHVAGAVSYDGRIYHLLAATAR